MPKERPLTSNKVLRKVKSNDSKNLKSSKFSKRINSTCATLVITFIICWMPQHVMHLSRLKGIAIKENKVKKRFCKYLCSRSTALCVLVFVHLKKTNFYEKIKGIKEQ